MRRRVRVPKSNQTGIWLRNRHRTTRWTSAPIGEGTKQQFRRAAGEACARARPKADLRSAVSLRSGCGRPDLRYQRCFCPLNPYHALFRMVEFPIRIIALGFERTSFFQPSMILTLNNRYGFAQGVMLAVWPAVSAVLVGGLRKFRGISVETLGRAIAKNALTPGQGVEILQWDGINRL